MTDGLAAAAVSGREAACILIETDRGWWVLDCAQRRFTPACSAGVWQDASPDGFVLPSAKRVVAGPVTVLLPGGDTADLGELVSLVLGNRRYLPGDPLPFGTEEEDR